MTEPAASKQTPAERVVELIAEAMPGFKAELHAGTDTIRVSGPVFFYGRADLAPLHDVRYAVPSFDAEAFARRMVETTRRHAIMQLGLEAEVEERARQAFERGRSEGYSEGYSAGNAAGYLDGRKAMLDDILSAEVIAIEPDDV